jgi:glutamine amidotransferase
MCDLLGFSSDNASKAVPLLHSFAEHARRNPHGWGIAYYRGSEAVLRKRPGPAMASKEYFRAVEEAEGRIIISHVRNASRGDMHERNCHPFRHGLLGRQWTFAHNGHIDGIGPHPRAAGDTDSEAVFHMLLDSIARAGDPYSGLVEGVQSLFGEYEHGRDIRLNFLLSDGEMLYAFNHHPEKPMYVSRGRTAAGEALLFSTQTLEGQGWASLPEDRLVVAGDGKLRRMSGTI